MAILNVNYDLRAPGKDYKDLIAKLQTYPWCHAVKSCWFIETDLSPNQLYNQLKPYLDANDAIVITPVTTGKGWWGQGLPSEVVNWLNLQLA